MARAARSHESVAARATGRRNCWPGRGFSGNIRRVMQRRTWVLAAALLTAAVQPACSKKEQPKEDPTKAATKATRAARPSAATRAKRAVRKAVRKLKR